MYSFLSPAKAIRNGLVISLATLAISWIIWIISGCHIIPPFISDFGIHPHGSWIFIIGVCVGATFVAIGMIHHTVSMLNWARSRPSLSLLARSDVIALPFGLLVCGACISLVFLPWNTLVKPHVQAAMIIFYGGSFWASLMVIGSFSRSRIDKDFQPILNYRIYFSLSAIISLACMINRVAAAFSDNFSISDHMEASKNFYSFCQYPLNNFVYAAALFEWMLILAILASVFSLHKEIPLFERLLDSTEEG